MKYTLRPLSNRKRKRTHGFLRRKRTRGGKAIIRRRRRKRRHQLAV